MYSIYDRVSSNEGMDDEREIDREREKSRPASTCRETDGEGQGISLALDCLDISQLSLCVQS